MVLLLTVCQFTFAQNKTVSGVVADASGEPLVGVNVILKGDNTVGTITDIDGRFSLKDLPADSQLKISYIGYVEQSVDVKDRNTLKITLTEDAQSLDEVVVVGYGVVKKRDLVGSVSSIKKNDITARPTTNVLESMQGKIAGLDMTQSSGQTGSAFNFTIRGNRSLIASNEPLILVDGVAYGTDMSINPNDVESIEVLKDASSTAIYGSRGANGVILVTTKQGAAGKARVDLNVYAGPSTVTNYPKLCNTQQYVNMKREAYRATGVWNSPSDDASLWIPEELALINNGTNTDWYDVIYGTGMIQDYQLGISGGNDKSKISLSLNYTKEDGIVESDNMSRYNSRLNASQKISNSLEVGASMLLTYTKNNGCRSNIFDAVQKYLPIGVPYDEDGSVNRLPFAGKTDINPLVDFSKDNYMNETVTNRVFGAAYLNWEIIKGLNFRTNFGYDIMNSRAGIFEGVGSTAANSNSNMSRAEKTEKKNTTYTWENILNYAVDVADIHSIGLMAGNTVSQSFSETTFASGYDLAFEQSKFHNLDGNAQNFRIASDYFETALLSYFGRVNYKLSHILYHLTYI